MTTALFARRLPLDGVALEARWRAAVGDAAALEAAWGAPPAAAADVAAEDVVRAALEAALGAACDAAVAHAPPRYAVVDAPYPRDPTATCWFERVTLTPTDEARHARAADLELAHRMVRTDNLRRAAAAAEARRAAAWDRGVAGAPPAARAGLLACLVAARWVAPGTPRPRRVEDPAWMATWRESLAVWPPVLQTPHQAARHADVQALWAHCCRLAAAETAARRPRWPPAAADHDDAAVDARWPPALRALLARAPWTEDPSGARLGAPWTALMLACAAWTALAAVAVAAAAPREATPACAVVGSAWLKRWLAGDRTHPQTLQTPRPCPGAGARLLTLDGLWLHAATHAELGRPPPPASAPGAALAWLLAGPWADVAAFCLEWARAGAERVAYHQEHVHAAEWRLLLTHRAPHCDLPGCRPARAPAGGRRRSSATGTFTTTTPGR